MGQAGWRAALLLALLAGGPAARPAAAADPERVWTAALASGEVTVEIRARGRGTTLEIAVRPAAGTAIEPPVLRIDASALVRAQVTGSLPRTVRGAAKGPLRASLPLAPGATLAIASPDSYDGTLRLDYRYCRDGATTCGVERLDLALRVGR